MTELATPKHEPCNDFTELFPDPNEGQALQDADVQDLAQIAASEMLDEYTPGPNSAEHIRAIKKEVNAERYALDQDGGTFHEKQVEAEVTDWLGDSAVDGIRAERVIAKLGCEGCQLMGRCAINKSLSEYVKEGELSRASLEELSQARAEKAEQRPSQETKLEEPEPARYIELPSMSSKDAIKRFKKNGGFEIVSENGHAKLRNEEGITFPIPTHPGDISPKLLKTIITQQAGMTVESFLGLDKKKKEK